MTLQPHSFVSATTRSHADVTPHTRPTCQSCGIGLERATSLGWSFPNLCVGCLAMFDIASADDDETTACVACGQSPADCRASGCWQWTAS